MKSKLKSMKFVFWLCFAGGVIQFMVPNLYDLILNHNMSDNDFFQGIVFMTLLWSVPGILAFVHIIENMEKTIENKTT